MIKPLTRDMRIRSALVRRFARLLGVPIHIANTFYADKRPEPVPTTQRELEREQQWKRWSEAAEADEAADDALLELRCMPSITRQGP